MFYYEQTHKMIVKTSKYVRYSIMIKNFTGIKMFVALAKHFWKLNLNQESIYKQQSFWIELRKKKPITQTAYSHALEDRLLHFSTS